VADIQHSVEIASKPETIHPLIATAKGFGQWWAADITEPQGAVELGFFNRATVYWLRLKIDEPPIQAEWVCETGEEWSGTHIIFRLEAGPSGTLLRLGIRDGLFRFLQYGVGRVDVPPEGRRRGESARAAVSRQRDGLLRRESRHGGQVRGVRPSHCAPA
jgi:hypothetical protein